MQTTADSFQFGEPTSVAEDGSFQKNIGTKMNAKFKLILAILSQILPKNAILNFTFIFICKKFV